MTDKAVRWICVFLHSGGNPHTEEDFPKFDFWCPDLESSKAQGERVLKGTKGPWRHTRLDGRWFS